jgi:hypothetical protein
VNHRPRRDAAITVILACIWFGAVAIIRIVRDDIPIYLLGVATLFFLMLVPSMKELVKTLERSPKPQQPDRDNPVSE